MARLRRTYSNIEKAEALALIAQQGAGPGAVSYAAKKLGVPKRTLYQWAEQHRDDIRAAVVAVEAELLPQLWALQQKLLERLEQTIPNLSGRDAVTAYGIITDKVNQAWGGGKQVPAVRVRLAIEKDVVAAEVTARGE